MANLFNHAYPYLDEHELNLDWLIAKMKELIKDFDEFKVVNNITFSGQWDITKNYPAWTIVNDNNIGYVSIQPVPVGVVLTNTDYWVEVIDYSAQIAGLQNRVVALENTVGDSSSGLVHDVNELTDIVDNIINLKVLCIGDSYGTGTHDGNEDFNNSWVKYLEDYASNITCYNYCVSGAGIHAVPPAVEYMDELVSAYNDSVDCNIVVLAAGANDYVSTMYIDSEINDLKTYIETNFNAKFYVFWNAVTYNPNQGEYITTYDEYQKACIKYNIPFVSIAEEARFTQDGTDPDNVHLRPNGYKAQGYAIGSYITSGYIETKTMFNQLVNLAGMEFIISKSNTNEVMIRNNVIYTSVASSTYAGNLNQAPIIENVPVSIASPYDTYLRNMFKAVGNINTNNFTCIIVDGFIAINGVYKPCTYEIISSNNTSTIRCTSINVGGWGYNTVALGDTLNVIIPPAEIKKNALYLCG